MTDKAEDFVTAAAGWRLCDRLYQGRLGEGRSLNSRDDACPLLLKPGDAAPIELTKG